MNTLKNKVIFISGASRGIGLAIALRAARDGAKVAIGAKTAEPHRYLPGTIYTAADEIEKAGGQALPMLMDVRSEESVATAVAQTVEKFGGIDICINNASAINLGNTESMQMKHFDLMQQVNARGTFLTSKLCIPHLRRAANPHVLTLSPPIEMSPEWFAPHLPYTISKYSMSMVVLGMAEEFRKEGIAFNALWPRTPIATAAVEFGVEGGRDIIRHSRTPDIMADAAYSMLIQPARTFTGRFCIDDAILRELMQVSDFEQYRIDKNSELATDLFVRAE